MCYVVCICLFRDYSLGILERINYFLFLSYLNYWEIMYRVWFVILKILICMIWYELYFVEVLSSIYIEEMSLDYDLNWLFVINC